MTNQLAKWLEDNKMEVSEQKINGSDIITIEGLGSLLYLHPFDGKIIDEDFVNSVSERHLTF